MWKADSEQLAKAILRHLARCGDFYVKHRKQFNAIIVGTLTKGTQAITRISLHGICETSVCRKAGKAYEVLLQVPSRIVITESREIILDFRDARSRNRKASTTLRNMVIHELFMAALHKTLVTSDYDWIFRL